MKRWLTEAWYSWMWLLAVSVILAVVTAWAIDGYLNRKP